MLDDYGTVEGETKAVDEFFAEKNIIINKPKFNYIPSYIVKPKRRRSSEPLIACMWQ